MSGCIMLKQAATFPAASCSNRQQHFRLQHAPTGGICLAATCLKRWQHVRLQHAPTGCNIMLNFVTTSHFYGLLHVILVALLTKHKNF
jgi:hypothetical protein